MKLPSGIITFFRRNPESNEVELEIKELILCKDCKFHYYHKLLKQDYCDIPANIQFGEVDPDGWCYLAERKEE